MDFIFLQALSLSIIDQFFLVYVVQLFIHCIYHLFEVIMSLPPRGGRHFKEILMGVGCP